MPTYQDTVEFSKYLIQLGDGASPTEAFTAPCGLKARTFTLENTTSESQILSKTAETDPMAVERLVSSQSGSISGEGVLDPSDLSTWRDWFLTGARKNARVVVDLPAADGGGHYEAAFILTRFENVSSKEEGLVGFSLEMQSAGPITWEDASA